MRILLTIVGLGIIVFGLYYFIFFEDMNYYYSLFFKKSVNPVEKMQENYENEIEEVCLEMDLPADYFKALVILESSGEKPADTRFESHVFTRLKEVRDGKSPRYGRFSQKQLKIFSEPTLKKMATSYGPLQIMGYHCIPLGITLDELNGEDAMRYAIQWADKNYGKYLRRGDYINAFHIHNTGHPIPNSGIPETHKPDYIKRGLNYIKLFKEKKRKEREKVSE